MPTLHPWGHWSVIYKLYSAGWGNDAGETMTINMHMGAVAHLKNLVSFFSGKCEVISIPICKNVPYNMTVFPNYFKQKTQEEAALEVHQFFPLVQVNCSVDLAFFLCSLYAPLCSSLDVPPLPCRELCLRVRRGCLPLLQQYGYQWPHSMACDRFPWGGGQDVCIDRPNAVDVTTPPPLPTKGKMKLTKLKLKSK